ncbi:hypothetical protein [Deinococcus roseus]|uniref:Uncharacterized protein n=1 Tax=Deinococcus roseus TaxID=392414 RepID=A0ABQ2D318_9DEIO|nr:hypothetical protein [Deinococcus roseus]GGJ42531.1 hypothetical protein GCM10008938_30860 [Deinococcus roseus]
MAVFDTWEKMGFGFFEIYRAGFQFEDFIDHTWNPELRDKVADYCRNGISFISASSGEFIHCSICGIYAGEASSVYSDGTFVWPQILWHHIKDHGIRIPENMLRHIESVGFRAATLEDVEHMDLITTSKIIFQ